MPISSSARQCRSALGVIQPCTYTTYMANKTISLPDDVVRIIETLDVPFSTWVAEQLRRHARESSVPFVDQLLADAELAGRSRPTPSDARSIGRRIGRAAPW